jgi:hypothetical protein
MRLSDVSLHAKIVEVFLPNQAYWNEPGSSAGLNGDDVRDDQSQWPPTGSSGWNYSGWSPKVDSANSFTSVPLVIADLAILSPSRIPIPTLIDSTCLWSFTSCPRSRDVRQTSPPTSSTHTRKAGPSPTCLIGYVKHGSSPGDRRSKIDCVTVSGISIVMQTVRLCTQSAISYFAVFQSGVANIEVPGSFFSSNPSTYGQNDAPTSVPSHTLVSKQDRHTVFGFHRPQPLWSRNLVC